MKEYFIIECFDENHEFGPYLRKLIYDENEKIIHIELTQKGIQEVGDGFNKYIGATVPLSWNSEPLPYNKPARKIPYDELMLELL